MLTSAFNTLANGLTDAINFAVVTLNTPGPLLGLVLALIVFELQERRKQWFAVRLTRQSLIAELKWLESQLSVTIVKCANQSDVFERAIQEYRWLFYEGFGRNTLVLELTLTPEMLAQRKNAGQLSNEQIAAILKSGHFKQENQALELPLSVVNAVIGAPTSAKLKDNEITSLILVKWQAYMLANEARIVNEFIRLTFTVSDEDNHRAVVANHKAGIRMYGRRAAFLLDQVRAALKELEAPGELSRIRNRFWSRRKT